jgi:tetratricopeptide (TPR) repeat protein
MAESSGIRGRRDPGSGIGRFLAITTVLSAVLLLSGGLEGQSSSGPELSLKRDLPAPSTTQPCPDRDVATRTVPPREREEAAALRREAAQAMILGDVGRARSVLSGAAALDPTSTSIQLQLGRALEELGDREGAVDAYCLALALTPSGPDRSEAEDRIRLLAPSRESPLPTAARTAFRAGVERFDASEYEEAEHHFSRALAESPEWAAAHYNRGLTRLRLDRREAALPDLARYLELTPGAEEASRIRAEIGAPAREPMRTAPRRSPAAAMTLGLVMPGMGQFYQGRSWTGTMYFLGAAGSAAAGFLYTEVEVFCLLEEAAASCPPESIVEERETRPFLEAGLVGAAAITVIGAVHALISTHRQGRPAGRGSDMTALRWTLPAPGIRDLEAAVSFDPVMRRQGPGVQATLRLQF